MITFLANSLSSTTRTEPDDETRQSDDDARAIADRLSPLLTADEILPRLIEQLEADAVDDQHLERLREHLGIDSRNSIAAKIQHLRGKVDDLEAYSDALEALIDEEGDARQMLEDLRTEVDRTDAELRELSDRVSALEVGQSNLREEVAAVDDSITSLDGYVRDLEGRHSREIIGVDAKVDRLEERVTDAVDDLQTDIDRLDECKADIESVEDELSDLRRLKPAVAALHIEHETLEGVEAEVDSMKNDLAELETFRSKFIEVVSDNGSGSAG